MDWRRCGPEEIEAQFNPRRSVPDFEDHQARHAAWSAAARAELDGRLDVAYGDGALHKVDIFPAPGTRNAPVHVFLHGGYWRAQDKANFAHVARTLVGQGICAAIANYDLCPTVTLDGTVASALRAIAWAWRHARAYGGDPDRLSLSGHSAGAHLCAMVLAHDWQAGGLPADVIKGAVPISGIFNPEPAMHTTVNAEIGLTEAIARRNDALRLPPKVHCPVKLFVGGDEPMEWIRQSELYAAHLREYGLAPELTVVPGVHHFDILDQYVDAASPIVRAVVELAHGRVDAGGRSPSPEV
jgi:arylformamidase